jgi:hypothetical protein
VATDSRFVAIEPYVAVARAISIVEPRADESLPVDTAHARRIVLDDGGYLDENPGSHLTLVLDGDVVRDVGDIAAPLTIGGLDASVRDPSPGEHVLVAVAVGPHGDAARFGSTRATAVAVRRFFVGPPQPPRASPAPMLVCLVPRGTYNGPHRARSALLDFTVLGGDLEAGKLDVRVRVAGAKDTAETVLASPGPYALRGLESGDYRFEFELRRGNAPVEGPWGQTTRTITVNLDGPSR